MALGRNAAPEAPSIIRRSANSERIPSRGSIRSSARCAAGICVNSSSMSSMPTASISACLLPAAEFAI
ncbi:hypothetical protein [Leucobacter soli]|uniref:hypothetical protein n=1 Tax=Leucobacter soli TaxID=2812850 RepID=UPI00361CFD05